MKKVLLILLSVMILSVAGCKSAEDAVTDTNVGHEETNRTEEITESVSIKEDIDESAESSSQKKESETAELTTSEEDAKEESKGTETQKQEKTTQTTATQKQENTAQTTEQPKEETTQESEPQTVGYSPDAVVAMAIAKCQAGGMITTQDNLANALAEGRITQEEYNEYYPYDGLENSYYSVFVETDLNSASTVSGQPLRSEEAIATYIADMLLLESRPEFNIVYAGVYSSNGTDYYEFRCLR